MLSKFVFTVRTYKIEAVLAIALIVGIWLRFYHLTFQSYWLDELATIYFSNPSISFSEMMNRALVHPTNPPLHDILLWCWFNIFGYTEFVGRSFPALISVISIIAIYHFGKNIFNREVGLYVAILAAINYFLIYYAQNLRAFPLIFLLSILSYFYFLQILRSSTISRMNIFAYLLSTILLAYTHYYGYILVASQLVAYLYYLLKVSNNKKMLIYVGIFSSVVLILAISPSIYALLNKEFDSHTMSWIKEPEPYFFLIYLINYFSSKPLVVFLGIIFIYFIYQFYVGRAKFDNALINILLIWIFVSLTIPYIVSVVTDPILHPRYMIIIMPAILLLLALSIDNIKNLTLRYGALLTIIILSLFQLYHIDYYSKSTKQQWREVLYEIEKSKENIITYDLVYKGELYKNYASMLDINLDIYSASVFKSKYREKSLPSCFWMLEAHGNWITKIEELNDESILKVLEIQKIGARGVLYAYNAETSVCRKKYFFETK